MAIALDILSYNEQESEISTTNTVYQDFVVCSFTPSQEEAVLIIGSGSFRIDPNTNYARMQLSVDSEILIDQATDPIGAGDIYSWGFAVRKVLTAGAHTVKITYSTSNAASTCYAKYGTLLVVRDAASATSQGINEDEDILHFYEI